ncbi:MAG: MiaB/RimO family radical SAM methylthiotransferase [Gemmatimonadales bacterium]
MKVLLRTYGCRANQYDTEAVRSLLASAGAEETEDVEEADFAIFNSCTVTASAEADLRSDVRAARARNPRIESVVMGCAAGIPNRDENIFPLRSLPGVSATVAGADLGSIAAALGLQSTGSRTDSTIIQTGARALLRIQDGCDEHCTFCATTIARGANRSRSIDAIVGEASALADTHPEIVITGIHIGTYGADTGSSLGELVETLIVRVPRVRFRLSSVEATEVDDRLAELFNGDSGRLAPHLHAPLQSGSNAVLKRMGRHWYSAESYEAAVMRLVTNGKLFALSADVIAGFPGETDADHSQTMSMIERLPFTSLHVFPYSPRPGTAAVRLAGAVSGAVARNRASALRQVASARNVAYSSRRIGQECDVVVTGRGKGLTEDYLSVSVSDQSIPRRARFAGRLGLADGRLTAFPDAQSHG